MLLMQYTSLPLQWCLLLVTSSVLFLLWLKSIQRHLVWLSSCMEYCVLTKQGKPVILLSPGLKKKKCSYAKKNFTEHTKAKKNNHKKNMFGFVFYLIVLYFFRSPAFKENYFAFGKCQKLYATIQFLFFLTLFFTQRYTVPTRNTRWGYFTLNNQVAAMPEMVL